MRFEIVATQIILINHKLCYILIDIYGKGFINE